LQLLNSNAQLALSLQGLGLDHQRTKRSLEDATTGTTAQLQQQQQQQQHRQQQQQQLNRSSVSGVSSPRAAALHTTPLHTTTAASNGANEHARPPRATAAAAVNGQLYKGGDAAEMQHSGRLNTSTSSSSSVFWDRQQHYTGEADAPQLWPQRQVLCLIYTLCSLQACCRV
jgi:transcription initiation factor TFIID subunit TAF12